MAKTALSNAAHGPRATAEKRHPRQAGTPLATIAYAPSCILDPAQRPPSTWGGARNRADRTSYYLSAAQVTHMLEAADFAERIGKPFNRHWTVHFEMGGIAEHDGAAFVGRLLSLVRKQVRRAGGELAALWARENGAGKGGHVHILLHIPAAITLRNQTRRWIKAAGGKPVPRASKVRTVGRLVSAATAGGAHYRANADMVLAYLVKAAAPETGRALDLPRYGEGGLVTGKRIGWTQNIGETARRKANS